MSIDVRIIERHGNHVAAMVEYRPNWFARVFLRRTPWRRIALGVVEGLLGGMPHRMRWAWVSQNTEGQLVTRPADDGSCRHHLAWAVYKHAQAKDRVERVRRFEAEKDLARRLTRDAEAGAFSIAEDSDRGALAIVPHGAIYMAGMKYVDTSAGAGIEHRSEP